MGADLFLRVLGPLRLERDGQAVDVGGARQQEVLARLAVAGGKPVTAEALLADVWGPRRRGLGSGVAACQHLQAAAIDRP